LVFANIFKILRFVPLELHEGLANANRVTPYYPDYPAFQPGIM
jgi:hypothetical protein